MSAILVVDSVTKSWKEKAVLSGASLRAVPGELRALIGTSGSGKSTLLKIAAGVVTADSGSVHFAGRSYATMLRSQLAGLGMFYLPDYDLMSMAWTVRLQLEMICEQFSGRDPVEAAEMVGLSDRLDHRPGDLSQGERRRAEVAAALVRRPRCLLADEPYRGISPSDASDLTDVFRGLAASGVAVIASGHELPLLFAAADRVTWCTGGRTQEMGPPSAAARSLQFRRECLGEAGGSRVRFTGSAS